tara:strand:- start:86566 stop:87729 length:1164 start_codon:yes stop_codon:yes gene_type:complete
MKKLFSLSILSAVLLSCQPKEKTSVEEAIASEDIATINAKKTEVLSVYDKASAELAELEKALNDLDTSKKLPIVSSFPIVENKFQHFVEIQGDVSTKQNMVITSEYPGTLVQVLVTEGDRVEKGQVLARIDDGGLSQQLAQAKTQRDLAKTTFERTKRLWDQQIGSEIQFLQSKTAYESAENTVNQLGSQLEKTTVTAPFSGIIDDVMADRGQIVGAGNPLIRIINLSDMYVKASVPESYIGKIKKGSHVVVGIPALDAEKPSTIRQVGNYINPANRTFTVEVPLSNEDGLMKPNLIVNLRINDYSNDSAIAIPSDVIQENAKGEKFVFLVSDANDNGEHSLSKQKITTGYRYNKMVEVVSGLKAGQTIVKEGAKSMRDGLIVKLTD